MVSGIHQESRNISPANGAGRKYCITLANISDCFPLTPPTPEAQLFADVFEHGTISILPYLKISSNVTPFLFMITSSLALSASGQETRPILEDPDNNQIIKQVHSSLAVMASVPIQVLASDSCM